MTRTKKATSKSSPKTSHDNHTINAIRKLQSQIRFCDSYTRLPALIELYPCCARNPAAWFAVLGEEWTVCDNVGIFSRELRAIFATASPHHFAAMMTDDERAELAGLPDMLTVYRGCYPINADGLSWSLCRKTALFFTTLNRYRCPGETPLLITGRAPKHGCVLKNDRNEQEIISNIVCVVDRQEMKP